MDPLAHTLTGGALAAAGLKRVTPLATAALLIGANVPDVDVLTQLAGDYASLAYRRGWTHGVLALAVWPFVVAGALLAFDRLRRRPDRAPARAGPLLAVSALAVATHPTLDWLNNYGMRWLMPFDGRWFYGDALFIIDPWVWLALGGVLCLAHSERAAAKAAWALLALAASILVFVTDEVPVASRVLWAAGVVGFAAARIAGVTARSRPAAIERAAAVALLLVGSYMAVSVLANVPARAEVRAILASTGVEQVGDVMIGPVPADPFGGHVVAETPDAYYTGRWHWLETPRFTPAPRPIPKRDDGPVVDAARTAPHARRYLVWSRFPYFQIETHDGGYVVRIDDARYPDGRLGGVIVRLDENLEPLP
ncbi:MAG TPA: metal-dependent hydrolase [Gammaproteobacteria bacterium]